MIVSSRTSSAKRGNSSRVFADVNSLSSARFGTSSRFRWREPVTVRRDVPDDLLNDLADPSEESAAAWIGSVSGE